MIDSKITTEGYLVPSTENHLGVDEGALFSNYQLEAYQFAVSKCKQRRRALDIGANYGIMSLRMIKDFEITEAFEPLFHEYLKHNTDGNIINIHPYALGAYEQTLQMEVHTGNGGRSQIVRDKSNHHTLKQVEVRTLDSHKFSNVDFIKMDVEGWEWHVMRGGWLTLEQCNVFMVEVNRGAKDKDNIIKYFKHRGLTYQQFQSDYVFWRN